MVPSGSKFLKLSIKASYTVTRNNFLPTLSDFSRNRGLMGKMKAIQGKSDFKVSIVLDGKLLPIWPIAGNVETLGKHFPWMIPLSRELPDLYKPDESGFFQSCVSFQEELIKAGWAFAVQIGPTICFCGGRTALEALKGEMAGDTMEPPDLTLDFYNADSLTIYESDGSKKRSVPISELGTPGPNHEDDDELKDVEDAALIRRLINDKKKQDFPIFINKLAETVKLSVLDFCNLPKDSFGKYGHVFWRNLEDWKGIDPRVIKAVFSRENFEKRAAQFPRVATILSEQIKEALETAKEYASFLKIDLGWEKLTEASFRQLLSDTRSNGRYKFGGMRLMGGRWVYDMAVPGRTENARFVFTRRPVLVVDTDGLPMYRFSFMSRWNRNTTGMRHTGFVKFVQPKKGILARIKRYLFLDQMDLDVHVKCSCPDFKYRWHKALADADAAATPTGIGGEASNTDPNITNPNKKRSLCKHLVCMGSYLKASARDHDKMVKALTDPRFETTGEGKAKAVKPNAKLLPTSPF